MGYHEQVLEQGNKARAERYTTHLIHFLCASSKRVEVQTDTPVTGFSKSTSLTARFYRNSSPDALSLGQLPLIPLLFTRDEEVSVRRRTVSRTLFFTKLLSSSLFKWRRRFPKRVVVLDEVTSKLYDWLETEIRITPFPGIYRMRKQVLLNHLLIKPIQQAVSKLHVAHLNRRTSVTKLKKDATSNAAKWYHMEQGWNCNRLPPHLPVAFPPCLDLQPSPLVLKFWCNNLTPRMDRNLTSFNNWNLFKSNVTPIKPLHFRLIKFVNKLSANLRFTPTLLQWHHTHLLRFLEHCFSSKISLRFFLFLETILDENELARCISWCQKMQGFKRAIGSGFFLLESIQITYISIKLRDPFLFINWMARTLRKISFWKHRSIFHFLKYAFRHFFQTMFAELQFRGVKLRLKGKISVAGNSRTRTISYTSGSSSFASVENRVLHTSDLIRTFTGVLGLQVWFFF